LNLFYSKESYIPYLWKSQFLSVICMIQFVVSLLLERRYDKTIFKYIVSAAWYPIIYWIINGLVSLAAFPTSLKSVLFKKKLATWKSPDRGIDTDSSDKNSAVIDEAKNTDSCTTEEKRMMEEGIRKYHGIAALRTSREMESPDSYLNGMYYKSFDDKDNIIKNKQTWWKRILEIFVTIFAWAFILVYLVYLIYGSMMVRSGKEPFSFFIYNEAMIRDSWKLLYISFIILLVEIVFMIFWKEYNRLRFGKLNRRKFPADTTVEEIAEIMQTEAEKVRMMQKNKINIFEENIVPSDLH